MNGQGWRRLGFWYSAGMKILAGVTSKSALRIVVGTMFFLAPRFPAAAQESAPAPAASAPEQGASPKFAAAADEVLKQMSEITGLTLREPLKKTLRSREEIRAYVVKQMNEEKNA